jgi:hypothetical protein
LHFTLLHEKHNNTITQYYNAPATMANEQAERPGHRYTEDKAVHLIGVYTAILSMLLLIGWMHLTLLNPLREEAKEMVCTVVSRAK